MTRSIAIGLLGFDGVQTLDLTGPLDAFNAANQARPGTYTISILTIDGKAFASEAGLQMVPHGALAEAGPLDTLIVAGGEGLRRRSAAAAMAEAIAARAPTLRRIVSVCTGIYGLAPTGLLDGRRATTHWSHARDVAARFPEIRLEPDAIFIKDGPFYTSAGITAAIDLSLALIEEDHGPSLAMVVARDLVVYLKRSGGQHQYSEPLRLQAAGGERFADLADWMIDNLDNDLSVDSLAAVVSLSPRQFSRAFRESFGVSPAAYVETLRLDAARHQIASTAAAMKQIAAVNGFRSDDSFSRAFGRRFGLTPAEYRRHFSPHFTNTKGTDQ
ncbi:GlxA family transcriptional regulator [Sphingomonas sp. 28-63-12]|uniref:GlxA family transcriptional regulator n=1 Tax=Sphingomonas sp. 28-63-12 TaxID=1970434 RepID=UPI000BD8B750|nr:MAG: AraC family transcriptional regulator [Sphingomonas sp. 28-63-12]